MEVNLIVWVLTSILCGTALGLAAGYFILRLQNKAWPFSFSFARPLPTETKVPIKPVLPRSSPRTPPPARAPEIAVSPSLTCARSLAPALRSWPAELPKSPFMREIESNLSKASEPARNPAAFEIAVLESEVSRVDRLHPDLKQALTAAYRDMQIANTLLKIYTQSEKGSLRVEVAYSALCRNIAERLALVVSLAASGI